MISGVTVTVVSKAAAGTDRFGNAVYTDVPERVEDVLIGEPTTDDMEAARAEGVTLAYTLHFPKAYTKSLEGCTVVLPEPFDNDGRGYRVHGDPRPYMDVNTPGRWNRPVNVEVAHG